MCCTPGRWFHTGWFVESLATQALIIFVIRTRKVPFLRSKASGWLTATTLSVVAVGVILTWVPLGRTLGFTVLPWQFWVALLAFIITYLLVVEVMKKVFYSEPVRVFGQPNRIRGRPYQVARRAARFTLPAALGACRLQATPQLGDSLSSHR